MLQPTWDFLSVFNGAGFSQILLFRATLARTVLTSVALARIALSRTVAILLSCLLLAGIVGTAQAQEEEGEGGAPGSVSYLDLKPAFIVNYGGTGRLRYLKTDIALRLGGGPAGQSQIRHHMPYVRHTIVMRLSRATEEELSSMEGKELLRQSILEEVRDMLIREEGEHFVDDLLFNSFIVQR